MMRHQEEFIETAANPSVPKEYAKGKRSGGHNTRSDIVEVNVVVAH